MAENMKASTFVDESGNTVEIVDAQARTDLGEVVKFTPQTLTDAQKAQFFKNIGLGTGEGGYVNVFDPSENTTDKAINNATILSSGAIRIDTHSSDKYYFVTGKLTVKPNAEYIMSKAFWPSDLNADNRGRCYSANDTPLTALVWEDLGNGNVKFTTPSGTAYVRVAIRKDTFGLSDGSSFDEIIVCFNDMFTLETYSESGGSIGIEVLDGSIGFEKLSEELQALYPLTDKVIVNMGDSIFGNSRPPKDVSTVIAALSGATVYNCAFGGCRMAKHSGHWDAFSMYHLADAIATGDWSLQDDALNYDDRTSYAEQPLALLKSLNFDDVDIITINYCINDFNGGNVVDGDGTDEFDTDTYLGALRYSVKKINEKYPHINIVIMSATWSFRMDDTGAYTTDSDSTIKNDMTLKQYLTKQKEEAEKLHLPYIDLYNIGINKYNRGYFFPANDGSHQNANGRLRIAEKIVKELY